VHTPRVSIVVPNYNHARFLPARIESLLRQSYQDFELILLDDCSTDGSREVLQSYASDARVRIEFNTVNSGSTFKQWNKGVRLARGEYVWIAESDDYADETLLEKLLAVLDKDPSKVFAYCRSWRISPENQLDGFADSHLEYLDPQRWKADYCADGRDECRDFLLVYNTIPNASAVVFRRTIYERVGGADETLRLCGDWKLWAAMALTGSVAYLGAALNYFRFHEHSVRTDAGRLKFDALESLQVSHWLLNKITPSDLAREKMCVRRANLWVPAVLSFHVPFSVKRQILREVRAVDPDALRHAIRPMLATFHRKFARTMGWARAGG
jgi:glycosyltransferase involved in cell wall biosynthesis